MMKWQKNQPRRHQGKQGKNIWNKGKWKEKESQMQQKWKKYPIVVDNPHNINVPKNIMALYCRKWKILKLTASTSFFGILKQGPNN